MCLLIPGQPQGGLVGWLIFDMGRMSLSMKPREPRGLPHPQWLCFGDQTIGLDSLQEQSPWNTCFLCPGHHFQAESLCSLGTTAVFNGHPLSAVRPGED